MPLYSQYSNVPAEVDIIIAGGGTAACTIAGRLAKADSTLSILVIEQGRNNRNDPTITNPAIFPAHLAPGSKTALIYQAKETSKLLGREPVVQAGGVLGGGSSINFMMYTRAQGIDYDNWKTKGWSQQDLLPLLKKTESYRIEHPMIDQSLHGDSGPINVSRGGYVPSECEEEIMLVALSLGHKEIVDLQDLKSCGGFSRWPKWISPEGVRQDAAHGFLHPLLEDGKHPNLHVLVETKVTRILFDNGKAIGVECAHNEAFETEGNLVNGAAFSTKAKKLVVIASGALSSPQILERSGVGNPAILKALDIPIVSEVTGVGENYQDHNLTIAAYKTSLKPNETIDGVLSGRLDFAKAVGDKEPLLGWNAVDVGSKLRPTEEEVRQMGPDFARLWNRDFKDSPERPLVLAAVLSGFLGDPSLVPAGQYISMGNFSAYPYSRGSIHITGTSVNDQPSFETGFLNEPADVKMLVWAYKKSREICRRLNFFQGELEATHPTFAEGSAASVGLANDHKQHTTNGNGPHIIKDIRYNKEDDEAIEKWVRENVNTTWHSSATCSMKPLKDLGVVDSNLNVYGVKDLKVCDLSIMPSNVAANTNSTAFLIGEKAAQIIAKELNLVNF
ncbi:MAG: hypothetical protein M1814_004676 [Vezdaea aestivalis]|nr:MAG: hypothetical protein M1814_004676 [Vezdaea aestivalis]